MRAIGFALAAWLGLTAAANAQVSGPAGAASSPQDISVGACAWGKLPETMRQSYLAAYRTSVRDGAKVLNGADSSIRSAVASCTGRYDLPVLWVHSVVAATAVQESAAAELGPLSIPRTTLDTAWAQAPAVVLQCARANAAKMFSIRDQTCPDPKAPDWFVENLKLAADNGSAARNALDFYNAKAQEEWVDALIAKFQAQSA